MSARVTYRLLFKHFIPILFLYYIFYCIFIKIKERCLSANTKFDPMLVEEHKIPELSNENDILRGFDSPHCAYKCDYTDDQSLYLDASVLVYHLRDINVTNLPKSRRKHQYYVFFIHESPSYSDDKWKQLGEDFWNLTFTYRKDSDIYFPYDRFDSIEKTETDSGKIWTDQQIADIVKKKQTNENITLQLVSNCVTASKREDYVMELKKFINISEFGSCTGNKCPGIQCKNKQIDKHLFFLAFDNSVCKHYITEKFWYLKRLIVPVVLSRMPYQGLGIPESAYIAASDFDSPKALAQRLIYLSKNMDEYLKYFEWTKSFKKTSFDFEEDTRLWLDVNPLCKLCEWAHLADVTQKHIKNISEYWNDGSECKNKFGKDLIFKT